MVINIEMPVHYRLARSVQNIGIVNKSVAENPNVSIPHRSQALGLPYDTEWRILHL